MDAPIFNFHDIVLLITAALSVVFIGLRFVVSGNNRAASIFLTLFFFCIALSSVCTMLLWNLYITLSSYVSVVLPYLLVLAALLKGPALLLYIQSSIKSPFRLHAGLWLHCLPAFAMCLYIVLFNVRTEDLLFESPGFTEYRSLIVNIYWYTSKTIPVLYGCWAVWEILKYKSRLLEQFADIAPLAPNWLQGVSFGFAAAWLWTLAVNLLGNVVNVPLAGGLGIADNYVCFVLVCSLFIYSMSHAHSLLIANSDAYEPNASEKNNVNGGSVSKVEKGISELSLHLKHNVNIEQFSEAIDLPVRETSAVINRHFGTNFFEFINQHRVNEAKQRLLDPTYANMTIADIYSASGFNSASAFQRFFKRFTGETPSAFRRNAQLAKMD